MKKLSTIFICTLVFGLMIVPAYGIQYCKDLLIIEPDIFEDFRGEYIEIYNEKEYQTFFINIPFN